MTTPIRALEELIEARNKAAFAKIHIINTEQVLVDFIIDAGNFACYHAPVLLARVKELEEALSHYKDCEYGKVFKDGSVAIAALKGETK